MKFESIEISREFLESVQPIVLVGGKSRRFGRDKLREPFGESREWLVQRPIRTLRKVFGARVKLVGACDPSVVPHADGVIFDEHPGIGPIGGIWSALRSIGGPVFVLAGDMPSFAAADVLRILHAAELRRDCVAVLAATCRTHPCAGVYLPAALHYLAERVSSGDYRLGAAIPAAATLLVPVDSISVQNINTPSECSTIGSSERAAGTGAADIS